ncbi:MAG: response regulator transcription factor [Bacteroidetes bacterium]|nr:response regulator transcription factor [Bacteroidota bacterium]
MIRILITDDHPVVRHGIRQILNDLEEEKIIQEAGNGRELFAKLNKNDFDIILLDISMPEGSGINVLKYIQNNKIRIVTIVVTNYPIMQYKNKCFELGADFFFGKASEFEEVFKLVEKLANSKSTRNT